MSESAVLNYVPTWVESAVAADPIVTKLAIEAVRNLTFGSETWNSENDARGAQRYVGSAMAYYATALSVGTLNELDQKGPVDMEVEITKPPEGLAPLAVREALVGFKFSGRSALQERDDVVRIHPLDFQLNLYENSKIGEASWYRKYMNDQLREGRLVEGWDFQTSEVAMRDWGPRGHTAHQYGDIFRRSMLGSFSTWNLLPLELFMTPPTERPTWEFGYAKTAFDFHEEVRVDAEEHWQSNYALALNARGLRTIMDRSKWLVSVEESQKARQMSWSYDSTTGDVTYYELHGEVIFDVENDIDKRDEHPGLVPERVGEQQLADWNKYYEQPHAPRLPVTPQEEHRWHLNRPLLGL